jgi:hypothetical protein
MSSFFLLRRRNVQRKTSSKAFGDNNKERIINKMGNPKVQDSKKNVVVGHSLVNYLHKLLKCH